jgi:hypothetical protein
LDALVIAVAATSLEAAHAIRNESWGALGALLLACCIGITESSSKVSNAVSTAVHAAKSEVAAELWDGG